MEYTISYYIGNVNFTFIFLDIKKVEQKIKAFLEATGANIFYGEISAKPIETKDKE